MAILIEHFAGAFPVWLAPEQVRVIPISDAQTEAARRLTGRLQAAGVRAHLDDRHETLNYRIREGEVGKVPYMAIVGQREAERIPLPFAHRVATLIVSDDAPVGVHVVGEELLARAALLDHAPRPGPGARPRTEPIPTTDRRSYMRRVTGIGGIFFYAKDPAALRAWYACHLGIDVQAWGGAAFDWTDGAGKPVGGTTAWLRFSTPRRFTSSTASQCPASISMKRSGWVMPALLTKTSTWPKAETTWPAARSHASGVGTSASRR